MQSFSFVPAVVLTAAVASLVSFTNGAELCSGRSLGDCFSLYVSAESSQCGWDLDNSVCIDCPLKTRDECLASPPVGVASPCIFDDVLQRCVSYGWGPSLFSSKASCESALGHQGGSRYSWSETADRCQECIDFSVGDCKSPRCAIASYGQSNWGTCYTPAFMCSAEFIPESCEAAPKQWNCFWDNINSRCSWCGSLPDERSCKGPCAWNTSAGMCTTRLHHLPRCDASTDDDFLFRLRLALIALLSFNGIAVVVYAVRWYVGKEDSGIGAPEKESQTHEPAEVEVCCDVVHAAVSVPTTLANDAVVAAPIANQS